MRVCAVTRPLCVYLGDVGSIMVMRWYTHLDRRNATDLVA